MDGEVTAAATTVSEAEKKARLAWRAIQGEAALLDRAMAGRHSGTTLTDAALLDRAMAKAEAVSRASKSKWERRRARWADFKAGR